MYRIEFAIRCESGAESKAIVRLDDIIDVVVKGPDCTITTDGFQYFTDKKEYQRIQKALVEIGNLPSFLADS